MSRNASILVALAAIVVQYPVRLPAQESKTKQEVNQELPKQAVEEYKAALAHYYGDGVPENDEEALKGFWRAQKLGHSGAWLYIGLHFFYGYGVDADGKTAVDAFGRAIEAGYPEGHRYLGHCHRLGFGVPQDRDLARHHLVKAAEREVEDAVADLRRWYPGEHLDLVGKVFDLAIRLQTEMPILIEVSLAGEEKLQTRRLFSRNSTTSQMSIHRKFVDEFTVLGKEWKARRTFLTSDMAMDGGRVSSPLVGATAAIGVLNGQYHFDLLDGRVAKQNQLEKELGMVCTAGADIPLPSAVRMGEGFEIDLNTIAPLLVHREKELIQSAYATATLSSFDLESGIAQIDGRGVIVEQVNKENEDTAVSDFVLDLAVDLRRRHVSRLSLAGERTFEGWKGLSKVSTTNEFKVELTVAVGDVARAARDAVPEHRPFRRGVFGVEFELPGYWIFADAEGEQALQSCIPAEDGTFAFVGIARFKRGPGNENTVEAVEKELLEAVSGSQGDVCRSAVGKGRVVRFEKDGMQFAVELYALPSGALLRFRYYGTPQAIAERHKDIVWLKATLREHPQEDQDVP